jgi:hypothetical protein
MKKTFTILFMSLLAVANNSNAGHRPDDHAPIGVIRDHIHKKGEIMGSYRFSYMKMKGLRNGDDEVSAKDTLNNYMKAPTEMSMKMHMAGFMYGITDQLTISAMGNFTEKEGKNINAMGAVSKRRTADIGDSKVNLSYGFFEEDHGRSQFNLATSLPTGNINKKHDGSRLPYSMQIGSGSYELIPGISHSGHKGNFSYGGQINGTFRLNSNDNDYKLGDSYNVTSWVATRLNNSLSISSRLDYSKHEAIEGNDSTLNKMMMPAANGSLYDKERLDLLFGVNFMMQSGALEGNRLAIEFGMPIYQRIDGPMLENDYKIVIGWQNTF